MGYVPAIAADFDGVVGGLSDNWTVTLNQSSQDGSFSGGAIRIQGTYYKHPNGTRYSLLAQNAAYHGNITVLTACTDIAARAGVGWLMFSVESLLTRFHTPNFTPNWVTLNHDADNICAVIYRGGVWKTVSPNVSNEYTFTPRSTDVLLGQFESPGEFGRIQYYQSYVDIDQGIYNTEATAAENNYVMCQRTGSKIKPENLRTQWDGLRVRAKSYDRRHPLEVTRTIPEHFTPSTSPQLEDLDGNTLYPNGVQITDLDP